MPCKWRADRVVMQARPRQRQELHKFANLTMKICSFARFARAYFIFARFARAFLIFVHFTVVTYQFNSRIASTHFTSQINWNNRETIAETRSHFFGWSPHCRRRGPCLISLLLMRQQRLPSKNVMPLVCEKNDKLDKDGSPTWLKLSRTKQQTVELVQATQMIQKTLQGLIYRRKLQKPLNDDVKYLMPKNINLIWRGVYSKPGN